MFDLFIGKRKAAMHLDKAAATVCCVEGTLAGQGLFKPGESLLAIGLQPAGLFEES
ncbi:MAG: hypothetical protein ACOYI4_03230 [Christensenellales bacterium]|jgi:hypothetical protein